MKLEAGKTYVTRDGKYVTLSRSHFGGDFPWKNETWLSWKDNGGFSRDINPSPLDIVREADMSETGSSSTPGPHLHAAAIIAWAGGATIEVRPPGNHDWYPAEAPSWLLDREYRVKPASKPNMVTWHAVFKNGVTGDSGGDQYTAYRTNQVAYLRVEIDCNNPDNIVLVSASLEKP